MSLLTKPTQYDIQDSNIALLGSDLEKKVREAAGDDEPAWKEAGSEEGIQIWRIEQFHVVPWPKERYGTFYNGDSYIVLHTYKADPEARSFSYNLHFWLGEDTSQDEAGTAAYKTVELDDSLGGEPVQFREVQGYESAEFLDHFPRFVTLTGGVATGFHHISDVPPPHVKKLYRITLSKGGPGVRAGGKNLIVREVPCDASSLVGGDVYVLDKGSEILQLCTNGSAPMEKYKAAEFASSLVDERQGQASIKVYDADRVTSFLSQEFGPDASLQRPEPHRSPSDHHIGDSFLLFRITDAHAGGQDVVIFEAVDEAKRSSLNSNDAFLVDLSLRAERPVVYIWIGSQASPNERKRALIVAQQYLYDKKEKTGYNEVKVTVPIVKVLEGRESEDFMQALS